MKAVIMAGGQGTRFWPVSVESRPKQFLQIAGRQSMLQETVSRLQPYLNLEDIYVVAGQSYVSGIKDQLPELSDEQLIVEPAARNTAPCIGLAALHLERRFPEEVMVVLPSDHVIRDVEEFHEVLQAGEELARDDWLITFGIEPTFPATGYGYLRRGDDLKPPRERSAYRVERFLEKPDRETANGFFKEGGYYWNSGMFVWKIESILNEIERAMPDLHIGLAAIRQHWGDPEKASQVFSRLKKISIDYGVMEQAECVAVLPCSLGWSDVGNWNALIDLLPKDEDGIVANCRVQGIDSRDCLVFAESSRLVGLIGVEGLVLVDTPNALLVCPKDRTEDVKKLVEQLKERGLDQHL